MLFGLGGVLPRYFCSRHFPGHGISSASNVRVWTRGKKADKLAHQPQNQPFIPALTPFQHTSEGMLVSCESSWARLVGSARRSSFTHYSMLRIESPEDRCVPHPSLRSLLPALVCYGQTMLGGSWVVRSRVYKSPNLGHNYSYATYRPGL